MSDELSVTSQLCEFVRKHGPVRTPALREAFPECSNPSALLAGPVKIGYLLSCEIIGAGANGRTSKLNEFRVSEVASGQSYEAFKSRDLAAPALSAIPLKHQPLRNRTPSREALEQPVRKKAIEAAKNQPAPLAKWPGNKKAAVYTEGAMRFVSAEASPNKAEPRSPAATEKQPTKSHSDAGFRTGPDRSAAPDGVSKSESPATPVAQAAAGLITAPVFLITSLGDLVIYEGTQQLEFTPAAALALADFTARVRPAIEAALANHPGASA
ncbi:MAG: hypothetical protein Q8Q80_01300 [Methyloversatilis sp.]|uniref:hypothetical protein n=1 Tax=Methyloversatilis sp. TaxID=2569862 RepID=UPI0027362552|nr:hypothetical protein [Methyloversatilis sp.]MDP3871273.1 hypothetical protein [Methyloversatilis sp.]